MAVNLSNDYLTYTKKNIISYAKLILEKEYSKEIFNELLDTYIKVRYYNDCEEKYKGFASNINYHLREKALQMMKDNPDKEDKIKASFYIFKYILCLDNVTKYDSLKDLLIEIDEYRTSTLGLYDENFISNFTTFFKENEKKKETYLEGFDSSKFSLNLKKTNNKNVFYVELDNSIKFPRIYSSYSINKVYNTGTINEQKAFITYHLVSREILKNIIEGNFNKDYIVAFPISIFEKKEKINRLFNTIDSDCIRNNLVIKLDYSDYLKYKEEVSSWIKQGYRVAVVLDSAFNYDNKSKMWLDIFSYIITDKDNLMDIDKNKIIIMK